MYDIFNIIYISTYDNYYTILNILVGTNTIYA